MKCSMPLGCHGTPLHGFLEYQGTDYKTTKWQRSGWGTSTSLMSVRTASQPIPALLGFTFYFGYFRSMETDQREKEEPSTSSAAWDVAANYVQKCTGCFAIAVLLKQSNCLLFISPETSEKLFSVINCNFHRTTCKWFLNLSQQQLKDFYFWCYKDSSGIYKTIYSASSQDKCKNSHHLLYCIHMEGAPSTAGVGSTASRN